MVLLQIVTFLAEERALGFLISSSLSLNNLSEKEREEQLWESL